MSCISKSEVSVSHCISCLAHADVAIPSNSALYHLKSIHCSIVVTVTENVANVRAAPELPSCADSRIAKSQRYTNNTKHTLCIPGADLPWFTSMPVNPPPPPSLVPRPI